MKLVLYSAMWSIPDRACEIRASTACAELLIQLEVVRFDDHQEIPAEVLEQVPALHGGKKTSGSPIWWHAGRARVGVMEIQQIESWINDAR